jgi:hypothetical protein
MMRFRANLNDTPEKIENKNYAYNENMDYNENRDHNVKLNEFSWRRQSNDPMQNIQIPEIRFASQGRKKRRIPIKFRRNGPFIAKNVFINDWTSSKAQKNKPISYSYNELNSMANIPLPDLQRNDSSEIWASFNKIPVFRNHAVLHTVHYLRII